MNVKDIYRIYTEAIEDYHNQEKVDDIAPSPYNEGSIEDIFYKKCWIDTIQWHCEDEVRDPKISGEQVRVLKNKIDKCNQERTNIVEEIDDYYFQIFKDVKPDEMARVNTESPAWALDRLSILALKLYHMDLESRNMELSDDKRNEVNAKLELLIKQKNDLIQSIHKLFVEVRNGQTRYNIYRQVKMYNDQELNPILRSRL